MYPSRENSKTRNFRSKSDERQQTTLYPRPCFERGHNHDIDNSLNLSVNSIQSPAFKQMSSATLSSIKKMNDSLRSRSAEKIIEYRSRSADRPPTNNQEIVSYLKKPDTKQIYEMRPILHSIPRSRSASPYKRSISPFKRNNNSYSSNNIFTRLDAIKVNSLHLKYFYKYIVNFICLN